MLYQALPIAALVATAFAAPAEIPPPECPLEICIDGINDCGMGFGGCFDSCKPWLSPLPPDCPVTVPPAEYSAFSPIIDDCSTRTVCADYVNECGIKYGGCFADCTPWPTFTPPPCPSTAPYSLVGPPEIITSLLPGIPSDGTVITEDWPTITDFPEIPTIIPTTFISSDDCSTRTVCADYINDCGVWYGGCFPDCTPWPTFTAPPCTSTSSSLVDFPEIPTGTPTETVTEIVLPDTATDFPEIPTETTTGIPDTLTPTATDFPEIPSDTATDLPDTPIDTATSIPEIPTDTATDLPDTPIDTATSIPEIPTDTATDLPDTPIETATSIPEITTEPPTITYGSISSISTDDCSTRTVCADYVNDCGVWYGGCFPDCTPWPTFTPPPCTTTCISSSTVCEYESTTETLTWGGCFDVSGPQPTYTDRSCDDWVSTKFPTFTSTETIPFTSETIPFTTEAVPPTTETFPPTTETFPPTTETVLPTTETIPLSTPTRAGPRTTFAIKTNTVIVSLSGTSLLP